MQERFEEFRRACPDVDEGFLKEHLSRLDTRYFSSFGAADLYRHLKALSKLSSEHPVEVLIQAKRDGSVDCTILAFDYPSEFSIITGILAGMGFNIHSGEIFTYKPAPLKPSKSPRRRKSITRSPSQSLLARRRIIDHFSGGLDSALTFQSWAEECENNMKTIIGLLERGEEGAVKEAKHKVNEMVVERLANLHRGG